MHNSFLKSFKKLFIVPYTALHVSGTLVPIIRSLPLLSSETTQQEHATRAAAHGTGGCECSTKWKAPDDGHKGARNM
jgi:hypothetical protein